MNKIFKLIFHVFGNIIYAVSYFVPKNKKCWIFGGWFGEKYSDNSRYLFEYINENCPEIKAIWLTRSRALVDELRQKGHRAYMLHSIQGYFISMRSKVAVVCQSKNNDLNSFAISSNTKVIQLWHGVNLKKIGYDDIIFTTKENIKLRSLKELFFPFKKENYAMIISTSDANSINLSTAFRTSIDRIKVTGFPRNDMIFRTHSNLAEFNYKYKILYMPTFRGDRGSELDLFKVFNFDTRNFDDLLSRLNAVLLIKLHPANMPSEHLVDEIKGSTNVKILECDDVYEILMKADILITDYSSIYFDYLLTDRPIIFVPFDIDDYLKKERELYFDYDEVTPGYRAEDWNSVMIAISEILNGNDVYKQEREKIRKMFHKYIDGCSSERVIAEIKKEIRY